MCSSDLNFLFGICILCWVCPWIRPETVELGSWVLTCFSYNKLTKYHYFLFSFKQFDLRTKFCLDFLMCVSVWQVSYVDYFLWIWNISNRWLRNHLLNIIVVFLLVKIRLLMYSAVRMKLLLYLFFPVFNVLHFQSMSTQLSSIDNLELETSHCLICHLGVMLFRLGALMWLSYILRGIISRAFESIQLHRSFNC